MKVDLRKSRGKIFVVSALLENLSEDQLRELGLENIHKTGENMDNQNSAPQWFKSFVENEFRPLKAEMQDFKVEMQEFKVEMQEFKVEMQEFKVEMQEFKVEMQEFKVEMQDFKVEMQEFKKETQKDLKEIKVRIGKLEADMSLIKSLPTIQREINSLAR